MQSIHVRRYFILKCLAGRTWSTQVRRC